MRWRAEELWSSIVRASLPLRPSDFPKTELCPRITARLLAKTDAGIVATMVGADAVRLAAAFADLGQTAGEGAGCTIVESLDGIAIVGTSSSTKHSIVARHGAASSPRLAISWCC